MIITLEILEETLPIPKCDSDQIRSVLDYGLRSSVLNYFRSLEKQEWEVMELVERVHQDKQEYSRWLFETFKLSGTCQNFYFPEPDLPFFELASLIGNLYWECDYKDGVKLRQRSYAEDGSLISEKKF